MRPWSNVWVGHYFCKQSVSRWTLYCFRCSTHSLIHPVTKRSLALDLTIVTAGAVFLWHRKRSFHSIATRFPSRVDHNTNKLNKLIEYFAALKHHFKCWAKNSRRWIKWIIPSFTEWVKGKAEEQEREKVWIFICLFLDAPAKCTKRNKKTKIGIYKKRRIVINVVIAINIMLSSFLAFVF